VNALTKLLAWLDQRHGGTVEVAPVDLPREEAARLWKLARPRRRSFIRDYGRQFPSEGETLLDDLWRAQDRQSRP